MAIYKFRGSATVSCWTEVNAETEEQAKKIAEERELGGLSIYSIYPGCDEAWYFDNDGVPQDIEIYED